MKVKYFFHLLYLCSCIALAWWCYPDPSSEFHSETAAGILIIFVFGLAFPSGFLYGIFYAGAMQAMPFLENIDFINTGSKYTDMLLEIWLPLTVIGYWQWFVALPWLWRKWKARKR